MYVRKAGGRCTHPTTGDVSVIIVGGREQIVVCLVLERGVGGDYMVNRWRDGSIKAGVVRRGGGRRKTSPSLGMASCVSSSGRHQTSLV